MLYNQLTSLNLNSLLNLTFLDCSNNQLTSLNIAPLVNLTSLVCSDNQLTSLDVANLRLRGLKCGNNKISNLDLSICEIDSISDIPNSCENNKLETLFIKNGKSQSIRFSGNPTLKYICADDSVIGAIQNEITSYGYTNCQVNSYCSFVPGRTFYTIRGNIKLDINNNGCDALDTNVPNLKFIISEGVTTGSLISNSEGNYSIIILRNDTTITS